MKDYSQIISRMQNTPWLIEYSSLETMIEIVNRHVEGKLLSEDEIRIRIQEAENGDREHSTVEIGGGVGIMGLYGSIFPKANLMTQISGATSLEQFRSDLRMLVNDEKVKNIVIDVDSPGGSSDMIAEAGDDIRAAREIKPVYAVANSQCCSGAFWLASQATKLYATPSANVGSLGVYTIHTDRSEQDKKDGVKVSIISEGEFKTAGNPHEALSDKSREYIQEHVHEIYTQFIDAVAQGRNLDRDKVEKDFGDAKVHTASKALDIGMIDGVKTLEAVVDSLLAQNRTPVVRSTLQNAMAANHSFATAQMGSFQVDMAGTAAGTGNSTTIQIETPGKEHAEPGTGNPPEEREQPSDLNTAREHRRDTPPIAWEEGEMEELVAALRERGVQVADDASASDIAELYANMNAELEPLRNAQKEASRVKTFRAEYPEEAARLERLETTDKDNTAKAFANRFTRFVKHDAPDEKLATGFSAVVLENIEGIALKVLNKELVLEDLSNVFSLIGNGGIVDYTTVGSDRNKDGETDVDTENLTSRQIFAKRVENVMTEDSLEYEPALLEASKRYPEEFNAYMNPNPTS